MLYSGSLTDGQEKVQGEKVFEGWGLWDCILGLLSQLRTVLIVVLRFQEAQCLVGLQRGNDCSKILTSCQMSPEKSRGETSHFC